MDFKLVFYISMFINIMILLVGMKLISYKGGIKYVAIVVNNFIKFRKIVSGSEVAIDRAKEFDKYIKTDNDIIFLGDSIVAGGQWSEYFVGMSCRNRGIGGDRTYHILERLDRVIEVELKKVFLLVGINDLIGHASKEEILINFEKILREMISKVPNSKIYVESILPINSVVASEVYTKNSRTVLKITNKDIEEVNAKIQKLCSNFNISFIDCYSYFLDGNKQCKANFTTDGIHLSQDGYLELASKLNEYVVA